MDFCLGIQKSESSHINEHLNSQHPNNSTNLIYYIIINLILYIVFRFVSFVVSAF